MFIDFIIGGIGGIVSRSAVAPIELNRIQRQNYFIPNTTLKDVYKKEGIRFFWKGNGTNCTRIFPQLAINYSIFRNIKFVEYFVSKACLRRMQAKPTLEIRARIALIIYAAQGPRVEIVRSVYT